MYAFKTIEENLPADTATPVSLYLRLRDQFPGAFLLESSDYHARENSLTFLCLDPIAEVKLEAGFLEKKFPDGHRETVPVRPGQLIFNELESFFEKMNVRSSSKSARKMNGFFGFTSYEAVPFFEQIGLADRPTTDREIPVLWYALFRFVVCIDHFSNRMTVVENLPDGQVSQMPRLESLLGSPVFPGFHFKKEGGETTNLTDGDFKKMVATAKAHCQRGDVFQVVLSRQFSQKFSGDEFNVYRALRSVNPSPYLFYADFGSFRLFGSSPEAQIQLENGKATIHPIAGTVARTGDDAADRAAAEHLLGDPKENAEHTMLVDLARNDLSRLCENVRVKKLKEVQFFSHVIHLVSVVEGELPPGAPRWQLLGETFPAGTLSGAPKIRAMQIIDGLEPQPRGFYGGCIGFFDLDGGMNHAILIRSFLSKNGTLHYQAGAGVVQNSSEASECQEVFNKIGALRRALSLAEQF